MVGANSHGLLSVWLGSENGTVKFSDSRKYFNKSLVEVWKKTLGSMHKTKNTPYKISFIKKKTSHYGHVFIPFKIKI